MPNQNKLSQIKQLLETAFASLQNARQLMFEITGEKETDVANVSEKAKKLGTPAVVGDEKIIEGVFDGQNMIGPDSKQYSVPANYASKSKLVEGDTLKLTIIADGSFIYKQIGPVERDRLVGVLSKDEITDDYLVLAGDKTFKVLLASVTYFKGEVGDEVVILTPKNKESRWAAVENIIKKPLEMNSEDKEPKKATDLEAQGKDKKVAKSDDSTPADDDLRI